MLERKEYQRLTIDLEQNLVAKLTDTAKTFGVPRVQVIRACLEAELPRLVERERKRRKRKAEQRESHLSSSKPPQRDMGGR